MKTYTSIKVNSRLIAIVGLALMTTSVNASIIIFDGVPGTNNTDLPTTLGSNLSTDVDGATISNGATPDIALTWDGGTNGGWDLYAGGTFWAALEGTSGKIAQMEVPTLANPMTITFTVGASATLQLNSMNLGLANDKTDPQYLDITLTEVGGAAAEVFSTLVGPMDGDGGDGPLATAVNFNFTGSVGTSYVLAFNDVDNLGADTISNNGFAIDDLSFNQVPEPSSTALLGLCGLALALRRRK